MGRSKTKEIAEVAPLGLKIINTKRWRPLLKLKFVFSRDS